MAESSRWLSRFSRVSAQVVPDEERRQQQRAEGEGERDAGPEAEPADGEAADGAGGAQPAERGPAHAGAQTWSL